MKTPTDLARQLTRQWQRATLRVQRLLEADAWPVTLRIGKPAGGLFARDTAAIQAHVHRWRQVHVGDVLWEDVRYRASAAAVAIPVAWRLNSPSEWVAACRDADVTIEFRALENIVTHVSPGYRELLVRERFLWRHKTAHEVVEAAQLADTLRPGIAEGKPVRLISGLAVDTKFMERHEKLLTRLLDKRFDGAASEQGLNRFLGAATDSEHWLLVVPLTEGLLPFQVLRIRSAELAVTPLPASRLIIVENEKCRHQLPPLNDCIAILGAGLDLEWLAGKGLQHKHIAYWGDMDTWGLLMLGRARQYRPDVRELLMTQPLFRQNAAGNAVTEPVLAQPDPPAGLNDKEKAFYNWLQQQEHGRLEQEFLPGDVVNQALQNWHDEIGKIPKNSTCQGSSD